MLKLKQKVQRRFEREDWEYKRTYKARFRKPHDYWAEKKEYDEYLNFLPKYDRLTGRIEGHRMSIGELKATIMKKFKIGEMSATRLARELHKVSEKVWDIAIRSWMRDHELVVYRDRKGRWHARWRGRRGTRKRWQLFVRPPEYVEVPKYIETRLTSGDFRVKVWRP